LETRLDVDASRSVWVKEEEEQETLDRRKERQRKAKKRRGLKTEA
jgi:hypothetical protein